MVEIIFINPETNEPYAMDGDNITLSREEVTFIETLAEERGVSFEELFVTLISHGLERDKEQHNGS